MLRNASEIKGYTIAASDGHIGTVNDFLFDDSSWLVRWLVVETGGWLSGRKVLLPVSASGHPDINGHEFAVLLTRQQVKDSPDVDTERPVSRQMEDRIYDYYGWSPYLDSGMWMGGYGAYGGYGAMNGYTGLSGGLGGPPALTSRRREERIAETRQNDGDPHLRSVQAVRGYYIHANDGVIGHVDDFLLDDGDWSIHYLVVDTNNWWSGKKVLILPRSARKISWTDKLVELDVDRQKVKDSPTYDSSAMVDPDYEKHFRDYYDAALTEDRPSPPGGDLARPHTPSPWQG